MPCEKHVQDKWEFNKQKGTKFPEAGMPLLYKRDGVRPRTALAGQPESRRVPQQDETVQFQCRCSAHAEP